MDLLFTNARLIDPATDTDRLGSLRVRGDRIDGFGPPDPGPVETRQRIDCDGAVLAPGLIDMLVTTGEPGEEHRETLQSAGRSAAAGGVTTMIVQPNTVPTIDDPAMVEYVVNKAKATCDVTVACFGALTRDCAGEAMAEFGMMASSGAIGFADPFRTIGNAALMRRLLTYARGLDLLIASHVEDPSLATGVMHEGRVSARLGLPGRPIVAETISLDRDLQLAAETRTKLHIAMLSCGASIDRIARSKDAGTDVSAGVAAAHTLLNEIDIGEYRTACKLRPPLRTEADRQAILGGIANGTVDVIVSAHEPRDRERKRLPFSEADFGAVGLETLLPIVIQLFHADVAPLPALLAKITANPARRLGLDAGRLRTGAVADLVLIDLDHPWRLDAADLQGKSHNTPFHGHRFSGRALLTVSRGTIVHDRRPGRRELPT